MSNTNQNPVPIVSQKHRYAHIDALRGIAVMLVVWIHVSESYRSLASESSRWLYRWAHTLNVGRIGVVIFFAISGFVIAHSIKGERKEGSRRFWIRRFFRLYPLFWLSVGIGGLVMSMWFARHYDLGTFAANATMLPLFFGKEPILGLYWTLEVELIFYLLCWLLFLAGGVRNLWVLFSAMIAGIVYFKLTMSYHWYSVAHIGSSILGLNLAVMFWGALYRLYYDDPQRPVRFLDRQIPMRWLMALATAILLSVPGNVLIIGLRQSLSDWVRFGLGYLLGIGIFLLFNRIRLYNRWIVRIGVVSYSIYLFHPIVFNLFLVLIQFSRGILAGRSLEIYLITNLIASLLLAFLLYRYVEKPSIEIGHMLSRSKQ